MTTLTGPAWLACRQRRRRDLRYAIALLPLLAPLGLAGLAAARLIDGRGALFAQRRIGRGGAEFTIYKTRTQLVAGEATPLGAALRLTSIDELLQVHNILAGEMSMFGPRPLMRSEWDEMEACLPPRIFAHWRTAYLSSVPGCISSYGHASRRDGGSWTREECFHRRAELDCRDVDQAGARHDRKLLYAVAGTATALLTRPGAGRY